MNAESILEEFGLLPIPRISIKLLLRILNFSRDHVSKWRQSQRIVIKNYLKTFAGEVPSYQQQQLCSYLN